MKIMSIMAHQDDFEFNTGGTFALLREHYQDKLEIKIVTTTRGAFGHHEMTPDETFTRRCKEAKQSASLIGAEYECLKQLDGSHLLGQVFVDRNFLGGLWNCIRSFEPDLIFTHPVITDPLAGIHIDHYNTAVAVRQVAYLLTVPHAFPTVNGKAKMEMKQPVIINVDDVYACEGGYDFSCNISSVYEKKIEMALCHTSQIFEWLPFNSGLKHKVSEEEWRGNFKRRHESVNQRYKQDIKSQREFFRITKWGGFAIEEELKSLMPMTKFASE